MDHSNKASPYARIRNKKQFLEYYTENEHVVGFDFFSSPFELETLEEGVFGQANMEEPSNQDAFIDTFFDFDLWEQENQEADVGVTNLSAADDRIEQQTAIWDP
ncbi:hypothetical protein O181_052551 [Austropuccinia psidii MF-1]|uniref:Uncharacterized protein n=1 Tax=Austropuccinia psidii MF-1 TaxID=1389203 RepID=A0A9Q3DYM8_9BASI|nr:hypothetical protein [Austropuccinia psidii MF-1]